MGLPKRRGLLKASWRKRPPLKRWTRNVAIRTEHAAMPLFGFQHLMAGCAFVKKLAVVGWHLYSFAEPAMRACKRAFRNNIHNRIYHHRTRSAPSFISWACAVDLSKRNRKSAPPCSQATLMADFILSARTMNFDGRFFVMTAKCDNVGLRHSGRKIAKN